MITVDDIKKAHIRIKPYIHMTPVLRSASLDEISHSKLYFKCENFQKSGSFKIRGVSNAVLQLSKKDLSKGVVTASSGNHGAALSLIVRKLGGVVKVVMPNNTPKVKVNNVQRNGGEVIWCKPNQDSRDETLVKLIEDTGSVLVHPYDDKRIIIGQGTTALELLSKYPDLEIIIVPISGGGLLAGTLSYLKNKNKNIKVYGAEPLMADDAFRSLKNGKIETNESTNTICDALRAQIGNVTFPIISKYVDGIITVSEEDIIYTMKLIWERLKIIIEPSCSIVLASVLKNKNIFNGKKIGLILSGGNVDLDQLPW
tara:strand:+ start:315 stop:1253 length:939 start_codon:yes stop_codon:yes gene_type:complete